MKKHKYEKPEYFPPSTEGIFIPSEAEQIVDEARNNFSRRIKWWWEKLSLEEKIEEWEKDSDLRFYVTNPKLQQ